MSPPTFQRLPDAPCHKQSKRASFDLNIHISWTGQPFHGFFSPLGWVVEVVVQESVVVDMNVRPTIIPLRPSTPQRILGENLHDRSINIRRQQAEGVDHQKIVVSHTNTIPWDS